MGPSPLRVPAFVVLSGGPIGAASVRQLLRAAAAGRLRTDRIVVVDRDPSCAAADLRDPRVRLAVDEWTAWLCAHLEGLGPDAHLVPYHWAPHVLVEWLARQVEAAGGWTRRGGAVPAVGTPVDRATRDGDRALSYATWVCPPTCIEPALCPHTRGPRDWSLAGHLALPRSGDAFTERIVFRCLHLVWGVGKKLNVRSFRSEVKHTVFDDHIPFLNAGIPAIVLIDLSFPEWHTTRDDMSVIDPESLTGVGRVLHSLVTDPTYLTD